VEFFRRNGPKAQLVAQVQVGGCWRTSNRFQGVRAITFQPPGEALW